VADDWRPSALNIETTARYEACLADGSHRPSGAVVDRWTSMGTVMPVCARCGVPYPAAEDPARYRRKHQAEAEREERAARRRSAPRPTRPRRPRAPRAPRVPAAERPCLEPGCPEPRWVLTSGYVMGRCRGHERQKNAGKQAARRKSRALPEGVTRACARCGLWPRRPGTSYCPACNRMAMREHRERKAAARPGAAA